MDLAVLQKIWTGTRFVWQQLGRGIGTYASLLASVDGGDLYRRKICANYVGPGVGRADPGPETELNLFAFLIFIH